MYRRILFVAVACALCCGRAEDAQAQFEWVGNTDANWNTPANWNPIGPPLSGTSTILTFNALAPTFSDLNNDIVGLAINRLSLGGGGTVSYTLGGNGITFTGSAGGISNSSTLLQTINLPISLSSSISLTNNGTAVGTDLRLNGSISLSSNTLTVRGTGDTVIAGAIGGAGGVTKVDSGTLVLEGANTFTGILTITRGSVAVGSGGSLFAGSGAVGTIVMGRGTGSSLLTLTEGAITNTGVTLSIGGTGADATTQSTIDLGSYGTATNVLTLGGTVTYSSTGNPLGAVITGTNAQIRLNSGRTFSIADSANAVDDLSVLVPIINGNATGSLTKIGAGTLYLGASNTYSGGTSLNNGTIVLGVDNAMPTAGTLTIASSTNGPVLLQLRGAISQTLAAVTFYGAGSSATSRGTIDLGSQGQLTINGNITVNGTSDPLPAEITGGGTSVLTVTGARTWNVATNELLQVTAPGMVLTTTGNVKTGAGTARIDAAISGAGGWDVRNGTLELRGENTFTGVNTLRGGTLLFEYGFGGGSRWDPSALLTIQGGALRMNGAAGADRTQTLSGVTLGVGFDAATVEVASQAGGTTTLDLGAVGRTAGGNLIDVRTSGTGTGRALTSSGTAGEVLDFATLNGDYATRQAGAGSTEIVAFTDYDVKNNLQTVVSGDNLTSTVGYGNTFLHSVDLASWRFNAPITQNVVLGGARVTSDAGILVGPGVGTRHQTLSGGILDGNADGELILNVTNTGTGELRIQSYITDTTSISKFGPGTLVLQGNNDFIGTLRVTSGTVRAAAPSGTNGRAIGDNALVSIGGGTLAIADGVRERIGGLISPLSLSNGDVTIGANSTLILNMTATPSQNYVGAYVGGATATLVKDGIGTLTVNQDNNSGFTGSVIVQRGLLVHSGSGVSGGLRNAASFTINQEGGLILDDNGASATRTRISSTAAVTLNGARGTFGAGNPAGLLHRAADNRNDAEVIGSLTLGGGSSYIRFDNQGAANEPSTRSGISVAGSLARNNNATLSVRGSFLGFDGDGTAGVGSRTRLYFNTTNTDVPGGAGTGPAEFGAGPDSGTTRRIIPYIIAEFVGTPGAAGNAAGTAVGANNRGNAFATYSDSTDASGAGLRALVHNPGVVLNGSVAEVTTFAARTSVDDNIRESVAGGTLNVGGSPIVQSLVIDNSSAATALSVVGNDAESLTISSGGILFTSSAATAQGITLTGFNSGINVDNASYLTTNGLGTRNEYIIHQMNTSAAGVFIDSPLTTIDADLVKSGQGLLVLGRPNLYQGRTIINEGTLAVQASDQLGDASAATNDIRLAGGTLRIDSAAFTTNNRDLELLDGTLSKIELTTAAPHRISGAVTGGGGLLINTTGTGAGRALQLGTAGAAFSMGTGGESSDLIIGRGSATAGAGELDLSASSSVNLNVDELLVGDGDMAGTAGTGRGVLRLSSAGANMITARRIVVSDNASADNNGGGVQSSIVFGSGTNTIHADSITVGGRKANGTLTFAPGGSSTIYGRGGNGTRADLYIGDNASGTAFFSSGTVDATGVNLLWDLHNLVIGRHGMLGGSAQGTLTFNQGTIWAINVLMGRTDYLGDSTNDAATTATINVNAGGILRFGNIRKGNGTAVINLAGTLAPLADTAIIENVEINLTSTASRFDAGFSTMIIQSGASVTGTGGFLKDGFGPLYLDAAMTYSGGTTLGIGMTVLGGHDRLPTTTTLNLGGVFVPVLDLHGFNQTLAVLNGGGGGVITNSGGGNSLLTVSQGVFTGTVQDGSGLVSVLKTGSGTLVFGGNNSFASTMTIAGGTFQIGNNGTTGAIAADIVNNANLALSRSDLGIYNGVISGAGTVTVTGNGAFALTGANQYTGATIVSLGALRAIDGVGLPTASNLELNGGVFESSGAFDRTFGTGADQVRWTGSGGFSAAGGDLNVLIGGNSGQVVWNGANFVQAGQALMFGSTQADSRTIVANAIDLGGATRTIDVADNAAVTTDVAELAGVVSSGGLLKTGAGTLVLSAVNTYGGGTTIAGGVLRAVDGVSLPTIDNLTLSSGVLETSGSFTRAAGTGSGQVRWLGAAGFAAFGGDLTVNLGGAGASLTRGVAPFGTSTLVFGSASADARVTFANGLNMNAGTLTVDVRDNAAVNTDVAEISGVLSNGSLNKIGLGTLVLSGANTFAGTLHVDEGVLQAIDGIGLPTGANLNFTGPTFGSVPAIFQSSGSFTRSLGAGPGQVQWGFTCRGGFAAFGGDLTVNIGGAGEQMLFNQNLFSGSFANSELQFGSSTATHRTIFVNPINLNGGTRSIYTFDNPATENDVAELAGVLSNGGVAKGGAGTLILSANNTYAGATQVNGGSLIIAPTGHINGNGGVTVAAGATLRVDAGGSITGGNISTAGGLVVNGSVTSNITVGNGGTLSGGGTVAAFTLQSGATLSPGNSVGQLDVSSGTATWNGGAIIKFEFIHADGTVPGDDWDYLNMASSVLQITASSSNKITLLIDSWKDDNTGHGGGPGADHNGFDPLGTYSWLFVSTDGLSPDLNTAALESMFNIVDDTPGGGVFGSGNPYTDVGGQFDIARIGDDLFINYSGASAIPEPSSLILSALAAAGFYRRVRRRRKGPPSESPADDSALSAAVTRISP